MKPIVVAILLAVSAPWLGAQEEGVGPAANGDLSTKIPRNETSSAQVVITLRNGSTVDGVVRDGQWIEGVRERGFTPEQELEGNGVRLWYAKNGFIFLEWKEIQDIEILRPLTEEELEALTQDAAHDAALEEARAKEADEARREKLAELEAQKAEQKLESELDSATGRMNERIEELYRAKEILEKFPPEEGWGEKRYRQIYLNMIRDDDGAQGRGKGRIMPQGERKEFYENYDFWRKALDWKEQGLLDVLPERLPKEGEGEEESVDQAKPAGKDPTLGTGTDTPSPSGSEQVEPAPTEDAQGGYR